MNAVFTRKFIQQYQAAPAQKQAQFDKQLELLLSNPRHPSLKAKIYDQTARIWQARVNGSWRFYFQIKGDTCYLLTIGPHPKRKRTF